MSALPRVLVTRPGPQAQEWVQCLTAAGVPAAALPLMEIAAAPDPEALRRMWQALGPGSLVMFVSPNAVSAFFSGGACAVPWPERLRVGATGPGTVAALVAQGVPLSQIVAPPADAPQFDSEALWALLRQESWIGRSVWIVRGDGGRDWLASTLTQAGARVQFLQAYRRLPPSWSEAEKALAHHAVRHPEQLGWHLSSSESLEHLTRLLPDLPLARAHAWATHPRIAKRAREVGFGQVMEIRPGWQAVASVLSR